MDAADLQERAWALQSEGKLEEAFAVSQEALALVAAAEGAESADAANLLNDLAQLERDLQHYESALSFARCAHDIEQSLDQFDHETATRIRYHLGLARRTVAVAR